MTDIPIIFSAPMVRALIEGRKTMTRRLAWRANGKPTPWRTVKPGDRLWVKETFRPGHPGGVFYRADGSAGALTKWKSSLFMSRPLSRLTLIVTATKIERLQSISEDDAMAEGVMPVLVPPDGGSAPHVEGFTDLWRHLHGPASWSANPNVVAITFRVVRANIDAPEARAA